MVQEVITYKLAPEERRTWISRLVEALQAVLPPAEYEHWDTWERFSPHMQQVIGWTDQLEVQSAPVGYLLNQYGSYRMGQGRYDEAEPLYERALEIKEEVLGPDHPDTAQSLNNLAALHESQGRYDKAEPLLERALAIREEALGPKHPHTQIVRNNYVGLLRETNQDEKADAVETRLRRHGPDEQK